MRTRVSLVLSISYFADVTDLVLIGVSWDSQQDGLLIDLLMRVSVRCSEDGITRVCDGE